MSKPLPTREAVRRLAALVAEYAQSEWLERQVRAIADALEGEEPRKYAGEIAREFYEACRPPRGEEEPFQHWPNCRGSTHEDWCDCIEAERRRR